MPATTRTETVHGRAVRDVPEKHSMWIGHIAPRRTGGASAATLDRAGRIGKALFMRAILNRRATTHGLAITALLGVLASAAPVRAEGFFPNGLAEADRARLERFDETRAQAIADARARGGDDEVAVLDRALDSDAGPLAPADIAGDWRCRTLGVGGRQALSVAGEVRCRIVDDTGGLRLETIDGATRLSGTFYDTGGDRLGFAGALATGMEAPLPYGGDATRDQAGYLVPVARDHLRLEIPRPIADHALTIVDLRR